MNFGNDSPFPALTYDIVDPRELLSHVIVARGTYDLHASDLPRERDEERSLTHVATLSEEQAEIAVTDVYFGEMNRSSVKRESDLAQKKPRCDVIVVGSAHSPTGEPVPRVEVGIHIERLEPIPGVAEAGTLLDHRLIVHGPRAFERRDGGWALTDPEPFVEAPLRYEIAFGGELKVYEADEAADRLDEAHRLAPEIRSKHPEGSAAPVAHATCRENPVGVGFLEAWYADAAKVERWPAPRIEAAGAFITAEIFDDLVRGKARPGARPELVPRGVGVVAKPWHPRLALAGTFDDRWLAERWPYMPPDFDMAYWNGAHPDMQCEHLYGTERVTMSNIGARGPWVFTVPEAVVAARFTLDDGEPAWVPAVIDTLEIDLDAGRLSVVWRVVVPAVKGIVGATLVALDRAAGG